MNKNFDKYLLFSENNKYVKIGVAISGGVDSATAAYILKKQGYDIFGVTMITCGKEDADAKKICSDLGIEHFILDISKNFNHKVIDYFVEEYMMGNTPNPCMICNKHFKLGKLLEFTLSKGAKYMATGHYAKIKDNKLAMGDDRSKDQVYFLSQCKKENLQYFMFPLGNLTKVDVRLMAKQLGVKVYSKKDSQEICFVEDGKLKEFLIEKSNGNASISGDIINLDGKILGKHKGLSFYTIGQRKGIGISADIPYYVVSLNRLKNQVIVGDSKELFKEELFASDINYFTNTINDLENIELFAKTRSRDQLHKCKITLLKDSSIKVNFINDRVRAITPGQGIVFYDSKQRVIASAFIK